MKIISFIEDESLIKKILKHLNLWVADKHDHPNHSPPKHILDLVNTNQIEMYDNLKFVSMNSDDFLVNTLFQYNTYAQESYDHIPQRPYEDEYSQLVPYED